MARQRLAASFSTVVADGAVEWVEEGRAAWVVSQLLRTRAAAVPTVVGVEGLLALGGSILGVGVFGVLGVSAMACVLWVDGLSDV